MTKLSQFTAAPTDFTTGDSLVGVRGGNTDLLFTPAQVKQGIDPELIADTTFYVRTDGSDSNNGLTNNSGGAWLTLQHAADVLAGRELAGFTATIQIADGTYDGFQITTPNTSGFIRFLGNTGTPTNVVIGPKVGGLGRDCILAYADVNLIVEYLKLQGQAIPPYACGVITAQDTLVHVIVNAVTFNGNMTNAVFAEMGSIFEVRDPTISITNCNNAFEVAGSHVSYEGTVTVTGTPAWAHSFVDCYLHGVFHTDLGGTVTGAATGKRFIVEDGGIIKTGTNNLSYFPGNVAGDIRIGGQYDTIVSDNSGFSGTVGALPAVTQVQVGFHAFVTDSTATLAAGLGNTVSGGGGNATPVYSDGTNWRIG